MLKLEKKNRRLFQTNSKLEGVEESVQNHWLEVGWQKWTQANPLK